MTEQGGWRERALWRLVESYHAVVYYAPERVPCYREVGYRGGWMAYFATRSAALGPVPPAVVTALFHGFAHRMVARALPDAWAIAGPEAAIAARLRVADRAYRRILRDLAVAGTTAGLADRLVAVVGALDPRGGPMFAAHAGLDVPDAPHLRLFWATTALRELRGDAHLAALRSAGIGPVESHVVMAALGLVPADQRKYRGWTEDEWAAGAESLTSRGWLDRDGRPTPAGLRARSAVERETDRLASHAWAGRDAAWLVETVDALAALVSPVVTAGDLPYPNGMGVPAIAELEVPR